MRGLLTVYDVAALTGWKVSTIRQKVWRREISIVKLGRSVRFRPEVIDQLIAECEIPAVEAR